MEKEEILKEAVKIIRQHLTPDYKIFLFGSWAKGIAMETSDLDIGIMGPKEVAQELMIKIKNSLGGILTLRTIEVVDLLAVSKNFKDKVMEYAQELN